MMRIGFRIRGAAEALPLETLARWAKDNGFNAIDIGRPDADAVKTVRGAGLDIGTFDLPGTSDLLSPDPGRRDAGAQAIAEASKAAQGLGLSKAFGVFIPADSSQSRARSFELWQMAWPKASAALADAGVAFALEGYPGGGPTYPALGVAPETVRAMLAFDASAGSGALKLNYDPSHLARIGVDPLRFLSEFGSKVVHAHGKDTAFDSERLYQTGRLGASLPESVPGSAAACPAYSEGWWRYCVPGAGEVDWAGVASGLAAHGYAGMVSVELEDADFDGTWDDEAQGLLRSRDVLRSHFRG